MRKSRRKLKNTLRQMVMKTQPIKSYGMLQKQCSEGSSCNTGFPKKEEKSQVNNLTQHINELEKEEQKKTLKSAEGRKS